MLWTKMPTFATVANKGKQSCNNLLIGSSGLLVDSYLEGKQNNNAETIANYRTLAGLLINMVLKTNPDNVSVENNQIVMK